MVAAYNPFEILNLPMTRRITQHGNHFIVLQRFNWPGIKEGFGFMATPYKDEKSGKAHAAQLSGKEGKLLNLSSDIESGSKEQSLGANAIMTSVSSLQSSMDSLLRKSEMLAETIKILETEAQTLAAKG